MQFKVPQFIDVEDKIFGPFTFSEFIYLIGGGGLAYVAYKFLGLLIGFIPIVFIIALTVALVFYKPNNKPFSDMLQSGLKYATQAKLYIWKRKIVKKDANVKAPIIKKEKEEIKYKDPRLNKSKLKDLAWSLDVLDLQK